jgi:hypothetical protein
MRRLPRLENGQTPDELILALLQCTDYARDLIGISKLKLARYKNGTDATPERIFTLLKIMTAMEAPKSWGEFSSLKITQGRLYLAKDMFWADGITRGELVTHGLTRRDLKMVEGQANMIERLMTERNFYKKQCGYEAKYGLMLWQCFGE